MNIKIKDKNYYITWKYQVLHSNILNGRELGERAVTICTVKDNGKVITEGIAICNDKDVFVKNTGRIVSLRDMMNKLNLEKSARREIWNQYLSRSSK